MACMGNAFKRMLSNKYKYKTIQLTTLTFMSVYKYT